MKENAKPIVNLLILLIIVIIVGTIVFPFESSDKVPYDTKTFSPTAQQSCSDETQNQNETDIDCGGTLCFKCMNGKSCLVPNDCISNSCVENKCTQLVPEETCFDEFKNQNETDTDCGGTCPACENSQQCLQGSDCLSLNCASGICQPALQACQELSGIICGINETCTGIIQLSSGGDCCVGGECESPRAWCVDQDKDGYFAQQNCGATMDCDDTNPNKNPGLVEVCDGIDNNCDGFVDESCECSPPESRSCGTNAGECSTGIQTCQTGRTWTTECMGEISPTLEICDGLDNDCDMEIDEECTSGFMSPLTRVFKSSSLTSGTPSNMPTIDNFDEYFAAPKVVMFKNEAESLQFAIKDSGEHSVSINHFEVSYNGQSSSGLSLELYRVDFANVTYRLYKSDPNDYSPLGYYTDPLIPYEFGNVTNFSDNIIWWITVRSSQNTSAGKYTVSLNYDFDNNNHRVSFDVNVLDVVLPRQLSFKMVLDTKFDEGSKGFTPLDYHGAQTLEEKEQVISNYLEYFSKNRISHPIPYYDPGCDSCSYLYPGALSLPVTDLTQDTITVDFASFDNLMQKYFDGGNMNFFTIDRSSWGFCKFKLPLIFGDTLITQANNPEEYARIQALYWDTVTKHLREKGWLNYSLIYIDEPFNFSKTDEEGEYMNYINCDNNFTNILRSVNNDTAIAVFLSNNSPNYTDSFESMHNIDYYAPLEYVPEYLWSASGNVNPLRVLTPVVKTLMDKKDKLGTYWTSSGHMHLDRPTIDSRIWGYKYWKHNVTLLYHWNVLMFAYEGNDGVLKPNQWESINTKWGAGGARLFYPPCKDGDGRCQTFTPNIIPSIRSEMYREALEDYDYLVMLDELIKEANALGVDTSKEQSALDRIDNLVQNLSEWTRNTSLFEDSRIQIAESIVRLSAP